MSRDLFVVSASDAEVLDLGWPARDHKAQKVELRFIEGPGCHVDVRCTWFALEPRKGGTTGQKLEATVTIPLNPDDLLELTLALMRYIGFDNDPADSDAPCSFDLAAEIIKLTEMEIAERE